ncbi:hypothetical protein SS50377_25816 [Spironucleus salmonicida]|uniref:HNH nuclease domain-containing protein n=1 Tax=Spironucleus salmonicida TaxID=348837 RepID=A0A9P8RWI7_9EUKA|nr:hypothetical protein SS50377_25816 [Spironucleus salmonicida]
MDKLKISDQMMIWLETFDIIICKDQFGILYNKQFIPLIRIISKNLFPNDYNKYLIRLIDKRPYNLQKENFKVLYDYPILTIKEIFTKSEIVKFTENKQNYHYYNKANYVLITDLNKIPVTLVDLQEFQRLNLINLNVKIVNYYPIARKARLHILIISQKGIYDYEIHHINQNQLDNRKQNLVKLTPQEHKTEHNCQFAYKKQVDQNLDIFI